jgi:hypothetical protein
MRLIVKLTEESEIKRLMIHDCKDGVYLFIFEMEEDGSCSADYFFETLDEAIASSEKDYGVTRSEWTEIEDPQEYCQQDWISPVRIQGRETGSPQWGKLEISDNGKWKKL